MDIVEKINSACVGHPHAMIPWPHHLLHDAVNEIQRLRAENEALRASRDTLLLDLADFFAWFNRTYPEPSAHPDHLWCIVGDRLQAYSDELAALAAKE